MSRDIDEVVNEIIDDTGNLNPREAADYLRDLISSLNMWVPILEDDAEAMGL